MLTNTSYNLLTALLACLLSYLQSMFYEKFITAHLAEKFKNDLFRNFTPKSIFLVIAPFFTIFCPSVFSYFTDYDSYSYCLARLVFAHYTPLVYTPTCSFLVSAP